MCIWKPSCPAYNPRHHGGGCRRREAASHVMAGREHVLSDAGQPPSRVPLHSGPCK